MTKNVDLQRRILGIDEGIFRQAKAGFWRRLRYFQGLKTATNPRNFPLFSCGGCAEGRRISAPQCPKNSVREASKVIGVSRTTIWRLAKEGKLKTVETRLGRKRILSQSITDFISGASNA